MTPPAPSAPRDLAAIVIGRNEGARLIRCLDSLAGRVARIVYVDSGSTDGSLEAARQRGAEVVELDRTRPFTAARARNAGLARLTETGPLPRHVQMVDGDCELREGWIETARAFLDATPAAAVACGRRRERFPEATLWNGLIDAEWDTPVGRARACGGDAMMRLEALVAVGFYDPALIAGEEPELCVRLRRAGWEIWRLEAEMTWHDAAMTRFGQWWTRARRAGHAYAEGAHLHGAPPERHNVAQMRRALIWGPGVPLAAALAALVLGPWALALLLVWPLQVLRLGLRGTGWRRALFLTLGKLPEALGVAQFHLNRLSGRNARLIEYK